MHSHGVRLLRYLDDRLVLASSEAEAKRNVQDLLSLCHSLGIVINEKSDLIPSQTANYLGMTIDTWAARIFPSLAWVEKFLSVAETFCIMFAPPVQLWQVVLGHLASLERLVPHSRLRMHSLQWHLKTHWSPESDPPSLVPGGERGFVLVDGEGPSSQRGSIWDTHSVSAPVLRHVSVGVGCPPPRSSSVRGVVGAGEVAAHQSSRNEGIVFGIAVISGVGRRVTAMYDSLTVVAYVNKQGRTVSRSLCLLASQLLRWSESLDVHLNARYLPGQSNVLADLLSRRDQVIGTEWSLHPQVARDLLRRWGSLSIDLFVTSLNTKLPLYCSLVPDPQEVFEDEFRHPWANLDLYAFPPFPLVGRVVARVRETPNLSMTLVTSLWPEKEWFTVLLLLLTQPPVALPWWDWLLQQPHFNRFHNAVHVLNLHAWRLSSVSSESRVYREDLLLRYPAVSEHPLPGCTRRKDCSCVAGVVEGALLQSTPLYP